MKCHTKILTAAIALAFIITGIAIADVSDDSSADSSDKIYITLTETLYFNDQHSINSSVNTINGKAGTGVCSYYDNTLTFSKNIDIKMDISSSSNGVMVFNNGQCTQHIAVDEGIEVTLRYNGNGSAAPSAEDIGTIMKKGEGNLSFDGKGDLIIYSSVPKTCGVVTSNNVYFEGNTYINSTSTEGKYGLSCNNMYCSNGTIHIESETDGVLMKGSEFDFKDCTVKIYGAYYGVRCSNLQSAKVYGCTMDAVGAVYSAFSRGPSTVTITWNKIYGSNDVTSEDNRSTIDLAQIGNYKHVMMEPQKNIDLGLLISLIAGALVFCILIVVLIIIIARRYKKEKKEFQKRLGLLGIEDIQTSVVSSNKSKESDEKKYADIMANSVVFNTTFILVVDGQTLGIIDQQISFYDMTPGMHEITILINNPKKTRVYRRNHIIRSGTKIVISKKLSGYRVEFR